MFGSLTVSNGVTDMDCSSDYEVIPPEQAEQWVEQARYLLSLYSISLSYQAEQYIRTSGYPMVDLSWIKFHPDLGKYATGKKFNQFARYVAGHRDSLIREPGLLENELQQLHPNATEGSPEYYFLLLLYKIVRWSPE